MIKTTKLLVILYSISAVFEFAPASTKFRAAGPDKPVVQYLKRPASPVPDELEKVTVEVHFDLLPTMMRFSMPCYPCMVTENGIHYSNGWTETYDPEASSSCEVLWDREARYARMWVESQNDARIVVRARAALADPDGYIAHSDIHSTSPYGPGDWTDEWYFIYPDGVHTRFVRIYTGLAEQSLLVTDQTFEGMPPLREIPPSVVHEFQEDFIFGQRGHLPEDDISVSPMTLIKLSGESKTFTYKPYPKHFGKFADAPIKVIHTKSRFKPFNISIPQGIENEPYPPEGKLHHTFQTWPSEPEEGGYSVSLGHTLNWWHYRRTSNILEQVYLSGMTDAENPREQLIDLAKTWLTPAKLSQKEIEPQYRVLTYDPTQHAYIVHGLKAVQKSLSFSLEGYETEDEKMSPVCIVNPAFVVKDWGESDFSLIVNGKKAKSGKKFRYGYETTHTGMDLILWLQKKSDQPVTFELIKK